jgi:hypothetical protein
VHTNASSQKKLATKTNTEIDPIQGEASTSYWKALGQEEGKVTKPIQENWLVQASFDSIP